MKELILRFVIPGNQTDPLKGNPIPKLKMTGRQHWTDKAQRYVAWKDYVRSCCLSASKKNSGVAGRMGRNLHPLVIEKGSQARMDIEILWPNEKHADAENVFGSIADALFENDKHLDGSFSSAHSEDGSSSVRVTIRL